MQSTHRPQPKPCNPKFHAQAFSRLVFILVFALAVAGTLAAQGTSPVGPYGFVLNGTYSDASIQGGVAVMGQMNFDGVGSVSGSYTFEIGSGGTNQEGSVTGTLTGSYSTNPGGTGTLSVALDMGLNATLAMVVDNRGRSLQLAVNQLPGSFCDLTETVISGVAEAEFNGPPHPIHRGFLNGSYGLQINQEFAHSPNKCRSVDLRRRGECVPIGHICDPRSIGWDRYSFGDLFRQSRWDRHHHHPAAAAWRESPDVRAL